MLTTELQRVQPTIPLPSPRALYQCARMSRRHEKSPSSRLFDIRPSTSRRKAATWTQGAQADIREGGAVGPQEGVHVRQARSDDGTVRGRFLPAGRRKDRQMDDQPESGRGETKTPAQEGRRRHREEADTVAAEVRRHLHRARRNAHRERAGLGRRQAGEGQRVPSSPRLSPHRGGPVERPAIEGRPGDDRRRVPSLVGGAQPSRRAGGVPQDFDDVRICSTGHACTITATRLRKAHIACARSADRQPGEMYDLSCHILHPLSTQQAS